MATRRAIKGVLGNFLGTYESRYSDYHGYWLFGFLVGELGELRIDLLGQPIHDPKSPLEVAVQSAAIKFKEQCQKAHLVLDQVQKAWLTIRRLPGSIRGPVNGRPCDGYSLRFTAEAVMVGGRSYGRDQIVFVAPHNAAIEQRSTRVTESAT